MKTIIPTVARCVPLAVCLAAAALALANINTSTAAPVPVELNEFTGANPVTANPEADSSAKSPL